MHPPFGIPAFFWPILTPRSAASQVTALINSSLSDAVDEWIREGPAAAGTSIFAQVCPSILDSPKLQTCSQILLPAVYALASRPEDFGLTVLTARVGCAASLCSLPTFAALSLTTMYVCEVRPATFCVICANSYSPVRRCAGDLRSVGRPLDLRARNCLCRLWAVMVACVDGSMLFTGDALSAQTHARSAQTHARSTRQLRRMDGLATGAIALGISLECTFTPVGLLLHSDLPLRLSAI